jgi:hypothetical protein
MSPYFLTLLAALGVPAAADGHEQANPLYRELREKGVQVTRSARAPLPAPVMADGLSADAQEAALKAAAGEDYSLEEFTRRSVVAPYRLHIRDVSPSDPAAPARAVDVIFIAYGDLKTVASKEFLQRVLELNREEGKARALTADELARHGITLKPENEKQEGYARFTFTLLDRVQLSGVGHSFWSRTADSVVAAGRIDSRFRGDADLPNVWRPVRKDRDGNKELGEPRPYDGAAYYVKVTRLARPDGALFVEGHILFTEPQKWFDGANLLRSKLPPVIQSQVRAFRRELLKAR